MFPSILLCTTKLHFNVDNIKYISFQTTVEQIFQKSLKERQHKCIPLPDQTERHKLLQEIKLSEAITWMPQKKKQSDCFNNLGGHGAIRLSHISI